jgi:hypothetical protein
MTETRAVILLCLGAVALEIIGIAVLAAIGVDGPGLAVAAIVPMVVGGDGAARVVMHFDESGHHRR